MSHHHHHSSILPGILAGGPTLKRRTAMGGLGALLTLATLKPARAGASNPQRLVIVNVRGGLDGMAAIVPYGDANLVKLRAALIPPAVGATGGMFDLGGFYGLDPNLPNLYNMYMAGQMVAVHAVGGISAVRSHFAGQTALQTGEATYIASGWMNRLVSVLPSQSGGLEAGIVLSTAMPIIGQGPVQLAAFAPSSLGATPNTLAALVETVGAPDPLIGPPIQSGFVDRASMQAILSGRVTTGSALQNAMQSAGRFVASANGPAVALVETENFDTHVNQVGNLKGLLADLDMAMAILQSSAGSAWANTVVMTITEFGRTAYINGCGGTDHGTAHAMFLAGGAVAGGRVISQWPGLKATQLYEGRDLAPTVDIRSIIMGVLQNHMQLTTDQLASVFPGATGISPMGGLVTG